MSFQIQTKCSSLPLPGKLLPPLFSSPPPPIPNSGPWVSGQTPPSPPSGVSKNLVQGAGVGETGPLPCSALAFTSLFGMLQSPSNPSCAFLAHKAGCQSSELSSDCSWPQMTAIPSLALRADMTSSPPHPHHTSSIPVMSNCPNLPHLHNGFGLSIGMLLAACASSGSHSFQA